MVGKTKYSAVFGTRCCRNLVFPGNSVPEANTLVIEARSQIHPPDFRTAFLRAVAKSRRVQLVNTKIENHCQLAERALWAA